MPIRSGAHHRAARAACGIGGRKHWIGAHLDVGQHADATSSYHPRGHRRGRTLPTVLRVLRQRHPLATKAWPHRARWRMLGTDDFAPYARRKLGGSRHRLQHNSRSVGAVVCSRRCGCAKTYTTRLRPPSSQQLQQQRLTERRQQRRRSPAERQPHWPPTSSIGSPDS
jgi:hypothetical protein